MDNVHRRLLWLLICVLAVLKQRHALLHRPLGCQGVVYLLDGFLLLGISLPKAFQHFDLGFLELPLLPLFLRDLPGFFHEVQIVHGVERVELDTLVLRILDPERL